MLAFDESVLASFLKSKVSSDDRKQRQTQKSFRNSKNTQLISDNTLMELLDGLKELQTKVDKKIENSSEMHDKVTAQIVNFLYEVEKKRDLDIKRLFEGNANLTSVNEESINFFRDRLTDFVSSQSQYFQEKLNYQLEDIVKLVRSVELQIETIENKEGPKPNAETLEGVNQELDYFSNFFEKTLSCEERKLNILVEKLPKFISESIFVETDNTDIESLIENTRNGMETAYSDLICETQDEFELIENEDNSFIDDNNSIIEEDEEELIDFSLFLGETVKIHNTVNEVEFQWQEVKGNIDDLQKIKDYRLLNIGGGVLMTGGVIEGEVRNEVYLFTLKRESGEYELTAHRLDDMLFCHANHMAMLVKSRDVIIVSSGMCCFSQEMLDLNRGLWKKLPFIKEVRENGLICCLNETMIYLIGGFKQISLSEERWSNSFERYNLNELDRGTELFEIRLTDTVFAQKGCALISHNDSLILLGGSENQKGYVKFLIDEMLVVTAEGKLESGIELRSSQMESVNGKLACYSAEGEILLLDELVEFN